MKLKDVSLKAFNIAGFIEFNSSDSFKDYEEEIKFSSWREESSNICPCCGEGYDTKVHDEI